MEHEALKQKYELLKTRHSTLEYQLDADKEESRLRYVVISALFNLSWYNRETTLEQQNAEMLKELELLRQNYKNLIDVSVAIY